MVDTRWQDMSAALKFECELIPFVAQASLPHLFQLHPAQNLNRSRKLGHRKRRNQHPIPTTPTSAFSNPKAAQRTQRNSTILPKHCVAPNTSPQNPEPFCSQLADLSQAALKFDSFDKSSFAKSAASAPAQTFGRLASGSAVASKKAFQALFQQQRH